MPESVQVEPDGLSPAERRAMASGSRNGEFRILPRFVSIKDACHYLGCGRTIFYVELIDKVKTISFGRRRLIDFDSLEALADELAAE